MKAQPMYVTDTGYKYCSVEEATHVQIHMPGPLPYRIIPVIRRGTREGTNCWSWNGDVDKPTLKPSILSKGSSMVDGVVVDHVCHTWVNDGKVQFLSDCTHEFANQTIDLIDVD